jgi:hypothetical protein
MRIRLAVPAIMVAFANLVPASAAPAPIPGVSANVELVTQFPDVQAMGARIMGRYLYMTGTTGLRIFDVGNPEAPRLAATVPMPIFSNEDVTVSAARKLVLVSSDLGGDGVGALTVIDVANPERPLPTGFLSYDTLGTDPKGKDFDGVGHIANCIADCARYAWITGARDGLMLVVDLADAAHPKAAGWFQPPAGLGNSAVPDGIIHDVNTDRFGDVWITGTGGINMVDASNPLHPAVRYQTRPADNESHDTLLMHNSIRIDPNTVLVTMEDWIQPQCGNGHEGSFQTWHIPTTSTGTLTPISIWRTEMGTFTDGFTPASVACSSHWFDVNSRHVVADSWYQQGVRFLDVSDPRHIRQVGYYIPPWEVGGLGISQTLFAPGRDDLVYAMSLTSGLAVLRIHNGGGGARTVAAPVRPEWFAPQPGSWRNWAPHPAFGYACLVPRTTTRG